MLLILYGKTGSGKDYLAETLAKDFSHFYHVKRPTTRPKRSDKETGYYRFYTDHGFLNLIESDDILFPKTFREWHYGVFKGISAQARDTEDCYILTVEKETAFEVADHVRNNNGLAYVVEVNAPAKTRLSRVLNREKQPDQEEAKRRMAADDIDYAAIRRIPDFYFSSSEEKISFQCTLASLKVQIEYLMDKYKKGEIE